MRAPTHTIPTDESGRLDARDRFDAQPKSWTWTGLGVATLIHILFLVSVTFPPRTELPAEPGAAVMPMHALRLILPIEPPEAPPPEPPPPPEVPPLPERIAPLARPIVQPIVDQMPPIDDSRVEQVALMDELLESFPIPAPARSIGSADGAGFEDFVRSGEGARSSGSADEAGFEHFVPSMVRPELANRDEVRRKLEREYPRYLQDAGIGGALMIVFWIDEEGKVHKYEIKKSSGNEALDEAAERVVPIMRFRPAYKLGRPVKIIVALPVRFESR